MTLHLVVPGSLDQRTGGYLYDARIVRELSAAGRSVEVHSVDGRFPEVDEIARADLDRTLGRIEDGETVVIDGLAMGGAPSIAARHGGRLRLIGLVHHPLADETGLAPDARARFERSEREALAHACGVIVTSAFTERRIVDFGVPPHRVRAVLPGTDAAPIAAGPPPGAPPRLFCVGTVTPRKGHDVLVAALAQIEDLQWRCVCAGGLDRDRRFAETVRAEVTRRGLGTRIHFLGELGKDALDEEFARASLFVLASHYEGYGMAFAEALARGLPVVGTTGGAIPTTVPADAGRLVPPGDSGALAGALRGLLENDDERATAARAARRHAASLPSWTRQAHRFAEAVDELAVP